MTRATVVCVAERDGPQKTVAGLSAPETRAEPAEAAEASDRGDFTEDEMQAILDAPTLGSRAETECWVILTGLMPGYPRVGQVASGGFNRRFAYAYQSALDRRAPPPAGALRFGASTAAARRASARRSPSARLTREPLPQDIQAGLEHVILQCLGFGQQHFDRQ
jgi:hypothetical protein